MRFALVGGIRREAEPGLSGVCPACEQPMAAKCGQQRVWHWAHQGRRGCDPWWENETDWHRSWKDHFPKDWQEVIHPAEDGEKHIADVKTAHGWALEFQHSFINPEERRAREAFYTKLVWVVDGRRRTRDEKRFLGVFEEGVPLDRGVPTRRVEAGEGALLKEWGASSTHVLFDFGGDELWWLWPVSAGFWSFIYPLPKADFVRIHRLTPADEGVDFDRVAHNFGLHVAQAEARAQGPRTVTVRVPRPRRRFRF